MKKHYSKPQVDVIVLGQQLRLLAGSNEAKITEQDWDPEHFDKP